MDLEPAEDDVPVPLGMELELDAGGATAARASILDHLAAELAPLLP